MARQTEPLGENRPNERRTDLDLKLLRLASFLTVALGGASPAQTPKTPPPPPGQYDLLLRGGHVIDPKNGLSAVRDVAIKDRKIAAVAVGIDPKLAFKTV